MAMKIKGIYKSLKFISQMFVVTKEREMEIGYPTDVKHVAHIGWDSPSITGPSWMNEFRTSPNFATSIGNTGEARGTNPMPFNTWSNQDMDEPVRSKPTSINSSSSDHKDASKKNKSRKTKPSTSSSSSSTRRSRAPKSKVAFSEATPTIQV